MNEKPSDWIKRRTSELHAQFPELIYPSKDKSWRFNTALVDYLDAQHADRKAAEKRYAETEPELPY